MPGQLEPSYCALGHTNLINGLPSFGWTENEILEFVLRPTSDILFHNSYVGSGIFWPGGIKVHFRTRCNRYKGRPWGQDRVLKGQIQQVGRLVGPFLWHNKYTARFEISFHMAND